MCSPGTALALHVRPASKQDCAALLSFSPLEKDIRVEVEPERLRPIDADLQVPNTAKFEKHTGWKPEIPFETTMRDLLEYWRAQVARHNQFLTR